MTEAIERAEHFLGLGYAPMFAEATIRGGVPGPLRVTFVRSDGAMVVLPFETEEEVRWARERVEERGE